MRPSKVSNHRLLEEGEHLLDERAVDVLDLKRDLLSLCVDSGAEVEYGKEGDDRAPHERFAEVASGTYPK